MLPGHVENEVILFNAREDGWLHFADPVEVVCVRSLDGVLRALRHIDERVEREGLYAAGFIGYEAAPAFDAALKVKVADARIPLLWFALYPEPERIGSLPEFDEDSALQWEYSVDYAQYAHALERIRNYIDRGDTYQVNYTERLYAECGGDLWPYFCRRVRRGGAAHAAFLQTDDFTVCSFSPELFFRRCGEDVVMRPMKGTAARALAPEDDRAQAKWLADSEKNRAENVMIVDMIRHDIGRVALPGSVEVPELFSVEQYSTVWQMTSTVRARVEVSNTELLKAVFPCASITGAPKCRAMQIIAELEKSSRGVYTGAIGWMGPGGRAEFGVAIRTLCRFKQSGQAVYGVGGGIVWDSDVREEYEECRTKSLVLDQVWPAFSLLESMLWTPDDGYFLLAYHLERLQATAQYFGFRLDCAAVASKLKAFAYGLKERCKVRLVLDDGGQVHLEASALPDPEPGEVLRVCLADRPINTQTPFVYHKTTRRDMYDAFRQEYPQADEVMLFNALGELTEACASNVAVECEGQLVTPPISSGLLGGTYRRHLLEKGALHERVIHRNELNADSRIFLLNSVRGSRKGRIV